VAPPSDLLFVFYYRLTQGDNNNFTAKENTKTKSFAIAVLRFPIVA
jgi:hypothetical protein